MTAWAVASVAAAAAHVGVQWVVHLVVYPALADCAGTADADRSRRDHGRRMSVAIAPVYAAVVVTTAAVVVTGIPAGGSRAALSVLAGSVVLAVLATTAFGAVPVHRALRGAPVEAVTALHVRLARTDVARLVLSVVHLVLLVATGLVR